MIYYNGDNTQISTQNSLTDKALLIKYFVVFSLTRSCCFLYYNLDMERLHAIVPIHTGQKIGLL